jgi:hypothetical protein
MAYLFKPTLDTITATRTLDGIKVEWSNTYDSISDTYHVYRTTTTTWTDTDVARIKGTQYIDKPAASGSYYYWVAYIGTDGSSVVFGRTASTVDYVLNDVRAEGRIIVTPTLSLLPPAVSLTTLSGENVVYVTSSAGGANGYSAAFRNVLYSGDTSAGTNVSASLNLSSTTGTNASPSVTTTNQALGAINFNGRGTNDWTNTKATTDPAGGNGTVAINSLQILAVARENFADNGTSVTNGGTTFLVRGYNSATNYTVASRTNFINHNVTSATYKADTITLQGGTTTNNYAVLNSTSVTVRGDTITATNSANTNTYLSITSSAATLRGTTFTLTNSGNTVNYLSINASAATLRGDTISLTNTNNSTTYLTLNATAAVFAKPVQVPQYTKSAAAGITGSVGMVISITDATPSGKLAYWDNTNSRWSYVSNDGAL